MKLTYSTYACDLNVAENFTFKSELEEELVEDIETVEDVEAAEEAFEDDENFGELDKDAVSYALIRYIRKNETLCKFFTYESWQVRLAKGRARKGKKIYTSDLPAKYKEGLPAYRMGLPGDLVKIEVFVDATGVTLNRAEILVLEDEDYDDDLAE